MRMLAAIAVLVVLAAAPVAGAEEGEETCNALFVHNARSVSMQGETLTMKGASPTVLFFCDRPQRFAGHLTVAEFIESVGKGEDSFAADPPNAVVSIVQGEEFADVVVTLAKKPAVDGDTLVFEGVKIVEGDVPTSAGPGSLFIDVIGRPMSPGSIAGVHRRHRRRAIRRCAAGVTCY